MTRIPYPKALGVQVDEGTNVLVAEPLPQRDMQRELLLVVLSQIPGFADMYSATRHFVTLWLVQAPKEAVRACDLDRSLQPSFASQDLALPSRSFLCFFLFFSLWWWGWGSGGIATLMRAA